MTIERRTKGLALLSLVLTAALVGGVLLATQASASTTDNSTNTDTTQLSTTNSKATALITGDAFGFYGPVCGGPRGFGGRGGFGAPGMGGFGPIEVSDAYKTTVTTIAENDTDVQQLIADGYNVTRVMPIIKTVIDADGTVVTKATNAVVVLEKDTSGIAFVSVDVAQSKVTQIITYTRTVIEK